MINLESEECLKKRLIFYIEMEGVTPNLIRF